MKWFFYSQMVGISILFLSGFYSALKGMAAEPQVNAQKGEVAFRQLCASCHIAGGNKVQPSKPVTGSAKLASLATFKAYLSAPVGHMPYYSHVIKDQATLQALYNYCRNLEKQPPHRISWSSR